MNPEPKTVILDIETYNLEADLSPIICVGWKYLGEKKVHCDTIKDFPGRKNHPFDDRGLCKHLFAVLSGADALVAHFGSGFDFKFIQSRMLYHGIGYLPPIRMLDTWKVARDRLRLTGNRLSNIAKFLRVKHQKGDSGGWENWLRVMNGDQKALDRMVRYCKSDVLCLEDVYLKLRPWFTGVPNWTLFTDRKCPACGSNNVIRQGEHLTKTRKYQRYQCKSCGSWHSKTIIKKSEMSHVPGSVTKIFTRRK